MNRTPKWRRSARSRRRLALCLATGLLAVNFWIWSLISPLATDYQIRFKLSPLELSALVALPVLIGSMAKVVFGALTDRFGGKRLFILISLLAALAAALLAYASSATAVLAASLLIGLTGASFAVGVPFVSAWFTKSQRGLALGIYSLGNAGTALAGLFTPSLVSWLGYTPALLTLAMMMVVASWLMHRYGENSPHWRPVKSGILMHLAAGLRWTLAWRLALLYALTFGAFVALGLYLPIILHQSYGLDPTDAALRAAGFILIATIARPVGGWLSDRLSGLMVLRYVFLVTFILVSMLAFELALYPFSTMAYLALAFGLGIGNGAIFAIIGHRCPPKLVGASSGFIAAVGGLGGFFPPLVLGLSFQLTGSYSIALGLLAIASLLIFASWRRMFGLAT